MALEELWDVCSPDSGVGAFLRPSTPIPEDGSAVATHAKQFNVGGKGEGKQGLEESPPRQKGIGWGVGGLVPSLAPSQPCRDSGQVTFLSGLPSPLLSLGRDSVSAEVRLEGVRPRVRGLCPLGTHHH